MIDFIKLYQACFGGHKAQGSCHTHMTTQSSLPRNSYSPILELFTQSYHEPYYRSYLDEDFAALAAAHGLVHVRNVNAFISKVMVFDKRPSHAAQRG